MTRAWFDRGPTPLIIGHRGASAHVVENTLAAFRRARADGADGVELDVMACKTGEVVVFHDEDLERLAARKQRIDALPLAALREVRLAGGEGISTLDEVLDELGPLLCNVEIKATARVADAFEVVRLTRAVVEILRRRDTTSILVSSFHPFALAEMARRLPTCRTGLLFHSKQAPPLRRAWLRHLVRPAALHPEHLLVNAARVRAWRAAGHAVHTWTVDDAAEVRRLAALAVDGLICNDPAQVRSFLL